ncbi:hypothetical protein Gasu_61710 [Galdieria sulphuraria]|uniref:Uncharacterized protein n=1 Tax=Galdieria sulphuraria TaxID=130081 RepID=M2VSR0_GALSU|nr:hypothetical protein Gasu_61710 [Galdieria sulphuraria]|eukprot:XP_005702706.1 hypothetical protein Gasu_61710 [Galdieria sulphuraria]
MNVINGSHLLFWGFIETFIIRKKKVKIPPKLCTTQRYNFLTYGMYILCVYIHVVSIVLFLCVYQSILWSFSLFSLCCIYMIPR